DIEKAADLATEVLESCVAQFDSQILAGMRRKIGLASIMEGDAELVRSLLASMEHSHADFTLTFRRLACMAEEPDEQPRLRELFLPASDIDGWLRDWQTRLASDPQTTAERAASMRGANPAFIPRNHRVELALSAAENGDYGPLRTLLGILRHPY